MSNLHIINTKSIRRLINTNDYTNLRKQHANLQKQVEGITKFVSIKLSMCPKCMTNQRCKWINTLNPNCFANVLHPSIVHYAIQ